MRKFGLLLVGLVLALGAMGIGYATWTQNLTATATVKTGTVSAVFQQAASNDSAADPKGTGSYALDAGTLTLSGETYFVNDIATSTVSGNPGDTLTITLTNAYPGYGSIVGCTVKNTGSIPIVLSNDGGVWTDPHVGISHTLQGAAFGTGVLSPGDEVAGYVAFTVADGAGQGDTTGKVLTITVTGTQQNHNP